ncbi:MAG: glucose 1-dehydrogenase [Pseudomonadota bacterium]
MPKDQLSGKVAVISGGSSGIGAAAAYAFVAEGAHVVIADINVEAGQKIASELGELAEFVQLDVRNPDDWQAAIVAAQKIGSLTTLVNSAGVSIPGSIEDVDLETFRAVVGINLEGTFLGCKFAVEAMKAGAGGSIINIASTLGIRPSGLFTAYASSKGGVRMLTKTVALHCAQNDYNIRCNAVLPGAIQTNMIEEYVQMGERAGRSRDDVIGDFAKSHPMKRIGRASEVASAIIYLASDASSYTTGADIPVDGGFLA